MVIKNELLKLLEGVPAVLHLLNRTQKTTPETHGWTLPLHKYGLFLLKVHDASVFLSLKSFIVAVAKHGQYV